MNPRHPVDLERAAAMRRADHGPSVHGFVPLSRHQADGVPVFVRAEGVYRLDSHSAGRRYEARE